MVLIRNEIFRFSDHFIQQQQQNQTNKWIYSTYVRYSGELNYWKSKCNSPFDRQYWWMIEKTKTNTKWPMNVRGEVWVFISVLLSAAPKCAVCLPKNESKIKYFDYGASKFRAMRIILIDWPVICSFWANNRISRYFLHNMKIDMKILKNIYKTKFTVVRLQGM